LPSLGLKTLGKKEASHVVAAAFEGKKGKGKVREFEPVSEISEGKMTEIEAVSAAKFDKRKEERKKRSKKCRVTSTREGEYGLHESIPPRFPIRVRVCKIGERGSPSLRKPEGRGTFVNAAGKGGQREGGGGGNLLPLMAKDRRGR